MLNRGSSGIIEAIEITASGLFFVVAHTGGIIPGFHSNPYYLITFFMKH